MKKKLNYRDKLLELAYIYEVKEIRDYIRSKKNLTSGQLELILKKNNIVIPKDYKNRFFKDNFTKPIFKIKNNIIEFKERQIKLKNKFFKNIKDLKFNVQITIIENIKNFWKALGTVGINFLNIIPTLGKTFYKFFADVLTDLFNEIYNQQINPKSAKTLIIGIFGIIGVTTVIFTNVVNYDDTKSVKKVEITKSEVQLKKEEKKPELKVKKEEKKLELKVKKKEKKSKLKVKKEEKKPELKVKRNSVAEVILPNLNLKTQTVLNLFKDVDYDLSQVRNKKLVMPIYFTQFPKDLDELQSTRLKKETFIKIVLPLVVAENEKILADKGKLKII